MEDQDYIDSQIDLYLQSLSPDTYQVIIEEGYDPYDFAYGAVFGGLEGDAKLISDAIYEVEGRRQDVRDSLAEDSIMRADGDFVRPLTYPKEQWFIDKEEMGRDAPRKYNSVEDSLYWNPPDINYPNPNEYGDDTTSMAPQQMSPKDRVQLKYSEILDTNRDAVADVMRLFGGLAPYSQRTQGADDIAMMMNQQPMGLNNLSGQQMPQMPQDIDPLLMQQMMGGGPIG